MTLADLPGVRALSTREKLQLMDDLWRVVAPELDGLGVSKQTKGKLDERWAAFLREPSSALSLAVFQRRLKALRD